MHHIKQKYNRNCGQIAVAALLDLSLEEVQEFIGHKHGTRTKELVKAIRHFGFECEDRCRRKPTDFGIVQVHRPNYSGWHWVAIGEGMAWDGHGYDPLPLAEYEKQLQIEGHRITSYLHVMRP